MPDPTLDPAIWQKLGWAPDQDPTAAGGASPNLYGGLSLPVAQGLHLAPPPAPDTAPLEAAPLSPPQPAGMAGQQLPSMADRQPAPAIGRPDYQVPAPGPGGGQPGPAPAPKPQKANLHGAAPAPATPNPAPQTFDQQLAGLQQREANTEQAQLGAIGAGVEAQKQLHADQLAAYGTAQQTVAANAEQRKAEDDRWNKAYAANQAQVQADRAKVDNYKYNPNKYMDELGVGGHIRLAIGQILAGIGQGMMKQGGPNPVTEMIQKRIHEANVAQQQERDALVQKLGFDRETGQDAATYHATRTAELEKQDGLAYTALGKQLEAAALKSADPIAQANGLKEAANVRAMGDERLKSFIQLKSEHDVKQQEIGIQRQQVGIAGGHLALARQQFDWAKNKDQQELDLKAAALLAKKDGKLSEEESKRAIFVPGPDGKPIPATRKDGTVVLAADPGDAGKIRRQVASTSTYNALIGQMARGMKDHGGESDWWHSKEWQDMKTDYKAAVAELHEAYGVQSFREPTIEFFDSMVSAGLDPTSFNKVRDNATEALANSNRNIQLKMNGLLGAQGYDREPITWQNTTEAPPPTQTEEQKVLSDALVNPRSGFDKRHGKLATELGEFSARGKLGPNETIDTRLKQEGGIMPSVRQTMATWGAALQSPDLAIRRHYYQQLEKIAQESESPETAAYAQQLLERAQEQQLGATTRPSEPTRGASGAPGSP